MDTDRDGPVELHQLEQFMDPRANLLLQTGGAARLYPHPEGDVFEHASYGGTARNAGRRNRPAGRARCAAVASSPRNSTVPESGISRPGDDPKQRGLARAGRPSRATNSPSFNSRADIVQGDEVAEVLLMLREARILMRPPVAPVRVTCAGELRPGFRHGSRACAESSVDKRE